MTIIEPTSAVMTGLLPILRAFSDAIGALDRAIYDTFVGESPAIHGATVVEVCALVGTLDQEQQRLSGVVQVIHAVLMGDMVERNPDVR